MTSGQTHDEVYYQHFGFYCPRPKKDEFLECLLCKFQSLIEDLTHLKVYDENNKPIWINQFIKGRTGSRVFRKEIIDTYIAEVEKEVKKEIRKTEEGIIFYRKNKGNAIRFLTFCVLNQKIIRERTRNKKSLSEKKSKIIHIALEVYQLEGDKSVNDATIQKIEELLIKKERKQQEQIDTTTSNSEDSDYVDDWNNFSREEETEISLDELEKAVIEVTEIDSEDFLSLSEQELEQIDFPSVENYFLEGDRELTETLIEYCPKIEDEKYDVTCDPFDDTYYLASRKIVHLFIYQNELFKNIDLSANCLLEQKVNIKELLRLVELHIRKHTQWELSKKKKNKFVLCTLCHLIREYKRLGQLDLLTAVKAFFVFMGKIYQLPDKELKAKMEDIILKLQLDEPKTIGEDVPTEPKPLFELLKDVSSDLIPASLNPRFDDKKDVFLYLESVWKANPHLKTKTEEEIAELRRRAKRIIEERRHLFKIIWEENDEFRPYLAIESLEELKKQTKSETKKTESYLETTQNIVKEATQFSLDLRELTNERVEYIENQTKDCDDCQLSLEECKAQKKEIAETIEKESIAINEYWQKNPNLRACIAKVLLEQLDRGKL